MIEEELGSLKDYSPINLSEIPQDEYDWMWYMDINQFKEQLEKELNLDQEK